MKTKIIPIVALGFLALFSSCDSSNVKTKEPSSDEKLASINRDLASAIFNTYLEIKDALVESNTEAAKRSAEKLIRVVEESDEKLVENIASGAQELANSEDIDYQREQLYILSIRIYDIISAIDVSESAIYKQYCPMAFDGKGAYWLSMNEKIFNPYFGDMMLHCGRIEEEL